MNALQIKVPQGLTTIKAAVRAFTGRTSTEVTIHSNSCVPWILVIDQGKRLWVPDNWYLIKKPDGTLDKKYMVPKN